MMHGVLTRIAGAPVTAVSADELDLVLGEADVARQVETALSGPIRILVADGRVLVQERTPKGELLIRRLASRQEAERFVDDRLEAYERMWDG